MTNCVIKTTFINDRRSDCNRATDLFPGGHDVLYPARDIGVINLSAVCSMIKPAEPIQSVEVWFTTPCEATTIDIRGRSRNIDIYSTTVLFIQLTKDEEQTSRQSFGDLPEMHNVSRQTDNTTAVAVCVQHARALRGQLVSIAGQPMTSGQSVSNVVCMRCCRLSHKSRTLPRLAVRELGSLCC